jgi:hypothetical protein
MIQDFYVENFMSFGERQYVSFEATSDKTYLDELTVEVKPGVRLLKTAIIYGANASGKSNLLFAIQTLWHLLVIPKETKNKPLVQYKPFALLKDKPTVLGITFYAQGIKYIYEIRYNEIAILSEKLEYVKGIRSALLYERNEGNQIKFGGNAGLTKKTINTIVSNTLSNHTVLSTFAKINIEDDNSDYETLYHWIEENIHPVGEHNKLIDIAIETEKNSILKEFIKETLCVSDFNITDFDVVDKIDESALKLRDKINNDNELPDDAKEDLIKSYLKNLEFTHSSNNGKFRLEKSEESSGTIRFFGISRKIYDLVNNDCIYLIDELEDSLHYDLMLHILLRFIRNSNNSQLVFTTHNILLLDEDFIRRDMVKLIEKSRETAETQVYSASDFKLHKKLSLFNAYKIGKFGAKPELGSTLISLKHE